MSINNRYYPTIENMKKLWNSIGALQKNSGGGVQVTSADITDSTATGRAVLIAANPAAARTAIGAGTGNSNLAIGPLVTNAKAGNYTPSLAEATAALITAPGYSATDTQTLKNISGVLTWVTDAP